MNNNTGESKSYNILLVNRTFHNVERPSNKVAKPGPKFVI